HCTTVRNHVVSEPTAPLWVQCPVLARPRWCDAMHSPDAATSPATVVVISTGGTIASRDTGQGAVATGSAAEIMAHLPTSDTRIEGRDLLRMGSYLLGHQQLREIATAVAEELVREDVTGVVVTHGTDTVEETAFLLDLVHTSTKPVVLTGAQRPADQPDTDGPRNLTDAVTVAASQQARGCGALVVFAGRVHSPQRMRKHHTSALDPFRSSDTGPLGTVAAGVVRLPLQPNRPTPLPLPGRGFDTVRVDVVPVHPNADAALADAAVR